MAVRRVCAGLVLAAGLVACSAGVETEGRQVPRGDVPEEQQGPPRDGEAVTAVTGEAGSYSFELIAQQSTDGLCLEVRDDEDGQSVGCGFEVPQQHDLGFFRHVGPGDEPTQDLVVGQVVPDATTVVLEYAEGASVEVEIAVVSDLAVAVFAAPVDPARELAAVVALAGNEELERRSATGS